MTNVQLALLFRDSFDYLLIIINLLQFIVLSIVKLPTIYILVIRVLPCSDSVVAIIVYIFTGLPGLPVGPDRLGLPNATTSH